MIIEPGGEGYMVIGYIPSGDMEILEEKTLQGPDYREEENGDYHGIGISMKLMGGLNTFSGTYIDKGPWDCLSRAPMFFPLRAMSWKKRKHCLSIQVLAWLEKLFIISTSESGSGSELARFMRAEKAFSGTID